VFDLAQGAPLLAEEYKNDPGLLAGMCMVKAVEARMDRAAGPAQVEQAMKEGYILTAYFYESLSAYEKQEQAFRLYVPELFKNINPVKEDKRIAQVQFATKREDRVVRPVARPAAPSAGTVQLEKAEGLYKEKQFEAASREFRALIQGGASKPEQAKAYYGLARIALQQNKPDLALELFRKILESEPEAFERAWAHVYLARLAMAASDPDPETARKEYQAALSVEGASEGARKAAEVEMARLTSK
jgi:tetratricopeptide (TPR) repeat protein